MHSSKTQDLRKEGDRGKNGEEKKNLKNTQWDSWFLLPDHQGKKNNSGQFYRCSGKNLKEGKKGK